MAPKRLPYLSTMVPAIVPKTRELPNPAMKSFPMSPLSYPYDW